MTSALGKRELLLTLGLAEWYRRQGYEVQTEARLDFLPEFRPDLVARKGDQVKVIEVKAASTLRNDPRFFEYREAVRAKPGWDIEFVLIPEPEKLVGPEMAHLLDEGGIGERLGAAHMALDLGDVDAALLHAWSACEAVIRNLVSEEGESDSRITTSAGVLEQATHLGLISHDDFNSLWEILKSVNAVIHGFTTDRADPALVAPLMAFAETALNALRTGEFVPDHAVDAS